MNRPVSKEWAVLKIPPAKYVSFPRSDCTVRKKIATFPPIVENTVLQLSEVAGGATESVPITVVKRVVYAVLDRFVSKIFQSTTC